jgi:hypothetical protein
VRRQRRSLLRRIAANVDPVRDHGPRHTVRAHLTETMAGHQAKQHHQAGEPGNQLARHRRLHDSHSGELGCPRANLVHPDMVAKPVAALRVVTEQQVGMLVSQQGGELSRWLLNTRSREPDAASRVIEKDWSVPAVCVAQVDDLVRTEDSGARP